MENYTSADKQLMEHLLLYDLYLCPSDCILAVRADTNKYRVVLQMTRKKPERITPEEAGQYVQFMCLTLNTAIKIMPTGVERWVWILDLNGQYDSAQGSGNEWVRNLLHYLNSRTGFEH